MRLVMKTNVKSAVSPVSPPSVPRVASVSSSEAARVAAEQAAFRAWRMKYEPVEREILAARERRFENRLKREAENRRAFGDLCEASEGLAVLWRRGLLSTRDLMHGGTFGWHVREEMSFLVSSRLTVCGSAFLHAASLVSAALRWVVESSGRDPWLAMCLARYAGHCASDRVESLRRTIRRPTYYAAETLRRQSMARARRSTLGRATLNRCPTREEILDAWVARKRSREDAVRFGSLIEDLACYVDSTLHFDETGSIVGRSSGVKGWLQENIPALYLRYSTVMRFKAMAGKLRQIAQTPSTVPAAWMVVESPVEWNMSGNREGPARPPSPEWEVELLRKRAVWLEVAANAGGSPTALMAWIDALVAPERVGEVPRFEVWRRKYKSEITLRTRLKWRKALWKTQGGKTADRDRTTMAQHNGKSKKRQNK